MLSAYLFGFGLVPVDRLRIAASLRILTLGTASVGLLLIAHSPASAAILPTSRCCRDSARDHCDYLVAHTPNRLDSIVVSKDVQERKVILLL